MSIIELQLGMSWFVTGCARLESDWMAMHRFLWMNAVNCEDLWRVLKGKKRRGPLPSSNSRFEAVS
jgi:hypothetical protein